MKQKRPAFIRELPAFFNKQYQSQPDGNILKKLQIAFIQAVIKYTGGKNLPAHMFFADDCFVVYRNLGFIRDHAFQEAMVESDSDQTMYARLWRIWVYAWSMSTRWKTDGAIVDCGTYNGKLLSIGARYCNKTLGERSGKIFAFDLFENPPLEAKKQDHGPDLHLKVKKLLEDQGNVEVVKGSLPETLLDTDIDSVTWAQIDLNSAEVDMACFEQLIPKLVNGAIVIFDDYGFNRYVETQMAVDKAVSKLGLRVLELPTGQGMLVFHA